MQEFSQKFSGAGATPGFPDPPARVHMIGLGGIGMAGLARFLADRGWRVGGCDRQAVGRNVEWLRGHGIEVAGGHDPAHIHKDTGAVIFTSALSPDEPELIRGREMGLPLLSRGKVLASLARMQGGMAVCGTHGKTTTAGVLARLLHLTGIETGWCIGGWVPGLDGPAGGGNLRRLVCEADESDGTLAGFRVEVLAVTNIEPDHMENFADFNALANCFKKAVDAAGSVVYCADDAMASAVCGGHGKGLGYGVNRGARLRARLDAKEESPAERDSIRVEYEGRGIGEICLRVPGRHNLLNALAALGAAIMAGCLPEEACAKLTAAFGLPERRFELRAELDGVRVISDYAHHPTALRALLSMVGESGKVRVIFQPHRYSRTRALASDFAGALGGADEVWIVPVYAASERPVAGGRSCDLYAALRERYKGRKPLFYASSLDEAWAGVRRGIRPGDCLLAVGAGDVDRVADKAADFVRRGGVRGSAAHGRSSRIRKALEAAGWRGRLEGGAALGKSTSLGVGAGCDLRVFPADVPDLRRLLRIGRAESFPVRIVGAGSNILVSDAGVDGVVVRLTDPIWKEIRIEGQRVWAGAGLTGTSLLSRLVENGLGGLEFMAGIPGTVGGWLAMNAGAHGKSVRLAVEEIHCLNPEGEVAILHSSEAGWGYRSCDALRGRLAIGAWFRLRREAPAEIRACLQGCLAGRIDFGGLRTAGSVFRNPAGDTAGRILDGCGCRGLRIGGARVYARHANVIHVERGATASDVRALIERMRARALDGAGIELFAEIRLLGAGIQDGSHGETVAEWMGEDAEKI